MALLLPMTVAAYQLTRVSVHDPSVVYDPVNKYYYIFGSHRGVAKSADMMKWVEVKAGKLNDGTPIGVPWKTASSANDYSYNAFTTPKVTKVKKGGVEVSLPNFDAQAWSKRGNSNYDISGNLKWCMYMSVNGDSWFSSIVLLTADNIEGPYEYQAPVVISGFKNGTSYKDTDLEIVIGQQSSLPSRYNVGNKWGERWPNNIDPCVFYDEQGKLWMSYGSWSGGIWMLELDENTGLRDYDVEYELKGSDNGITVDPYFGKKIAGGYYVSGEASYIEYVGGYYYLFVTYGGLAAGGNAGDYNNGGYQMRVFRSENPDGPFVDSRGINAVFNSYQLNFGPNAVSNRGVNIFGAYTNWGNQAKGNYGERSQGHNSIIAAEDGRTYLVYHTRFQNWGETHQVRVHQVFQNKDGWLVAAPFEYTGEEVTSEEIATTQQVATEKIPGKYKLLIHKYKLDHTKKEAAEPVEVTLTAEKKIIGDLTGTWAVTEGTSYMNMVIGGIAYRGVMVEQTLEQKTTKTIAFTGLAYKSSGTDGVTLWAYQTEPSSTDISEITENDSQTTTATYDLSGHRVDNPQRKGIYIRNGKKILVR